MKLSPEKQKSLAINMVIVVVLIIAGWWFGVQEMISKKESDTKKLKSLAVEVAKESDLIEKERKNSQEAQAYKDYSAVMEKKLPTGNAETWLVSRITQLAAQQKLDIFQPAVQPIDDLTDFKFKGLPYKIVGLRFNTLAEFPQLGKFLEEIENEEPLMEIDDLSISSGSGKAPDLHTISMRVSMVVKQ